MVMVRAEKTRFKPRFTKNAQLWLSIHPLVSEFDVSMFGSPRHRKKLMSLLDETEKECGTNRNICDERPEDTKTSHICDKLKGEP